MTILRLPYTNEFMLVGADGFKIAIYPTKREAEQARRQLVRADAPLKQEK
jgi:hypothetical protein